MFKLNIFLPTSILILLSGCAASYLPVKENLTIGDPIILPSVLEETSGLYCTSTGLISINDSGNAAQLFHISYEGKLLKTDNVSLVNNDWEALSASNTHWYIADVGNNKGKRETVTVHKIKRDDINDIHSLTLAYAENNPKRNLPYVHDFDAEAMGYMNDKLLLISKSWKSGVARVYEVDESQTNQVLRPIALIEGLPGVITGIDYDKKHGVYVVVGYKSDPFGNFDTFMAQLNHEFAPINIWPLKAYKQVEGVCVDNAGQYWFTEEKAGTREASLTRASIAER